MTGKKNSPKAEIMVDFQQEHVKDYFNKNSTIMSGNKPEKQTYRFLQ